MRSLLTAMRAVGVIARVTKLSIGYQYQCCMKSTRPVMAFCLMFPSRVVKEIVAFRPAALMIPFEIMEPILERISSLRSDVILLKSFLIVATLGSCASVTWMKTKERAIRAPYRTQSLSSFVSGAKSLRASLRPVPEHPIPTAMAAP